MLYICSMINKIESTIISGIYIIRNTINDKVYIGGSSRLYSRFIEHKSVLLRNKHNRIFQNFVNKYGIECLSFELIEEVICEKDKLLQREQFWIDYFQSFNSRKGFNMCKKADSPLGMKHTEEFKKAQSKRMMGHTINVGRKVSDETKEKISRASLGRKIPKHCIDALIKRNKGNKYGVGNTNRRNKGKTIFIFKDGLLLDKLKLRGIMKKYKLYETSISLVCRGKKEHIRGYTMRYE